MVRIKPQANQALSKVVVVDEAKALVRDSKKTRVRPRDFSLRFTKILREAKFHVFKTGRKATLDLTGLNAPNMQLDGYNIYPDSNKTIKLGLKFGYSQNESKLRLILKDANLKRLKANSIAWKNVDLSGADLSHAKLNENCFDDVNFNNANLSNGRWWDVGFYKASCIRASFENTLLKLNGYIDESDFRNANMRSAKIFGSGDRLSDSKFDGADFTNCIFREVVFLISSLKKAIFNGVDAADLRFCGSDLRGMQAMFADFGNVIFDTTLVGTKDPDKPRLAKNDLRKANFSYSALYNSSGLLDKECSNLKGLNLFRSFLEEEQESGLLEKGAICKEPDLQKHGLDNLNFAFKDINRIPNLKKARLPGVILKSKSLKNRDLRGVNLQGANLSSVNFTNANLSEANLSMANCNKAKFAGADLTNATIDQAKKMNLTQSQRAETHTARRKGMDDGARRFARARAVDPELR